jgi:hypothetical protein
MPGAGKIDPSARSLRPGVYAMGVRGGKAEAGLAAALQQGRTVRFEAFGVGQGAVDAG